MINLENFLKKFGLHIDKEELEGNERVNIYNEDFDILGCYNKNDDSIFSFIENGCISAREDKVNKKIDFTIAKQYSNELLKGYLNDSNFLCFDAFELGYRKQNRKYSYIYDPVDRSFILSDSLKKIVLTKCGDQIKCADDISSFKIEVSNNSIIYSKSSKNNDEQIYGIVDLEGKNMNEEINIIMNNINKDAVDMFLDAKKFIWDFQEGLENKLFAPDLNLSKIKEKGKKSRILKKKEKRR